MFSSGWNRIVPFVLGFEAGLDRPRSSRAASERFAKDRRVAQRLRGVSLQQGPSFSSMRCSASSTSGKNDLFKILTIVSVVGIPPTVVAGIYGMKLQDHAGIETGAWGYPYGLAMIVLSTLIPLAWFQMARPGF